MEEVHAKIQFEDYIVREISFEFSETLEVKTGIPLDVEISHDIQITEDTTQAVVVLGADVKPEEEPPFFTLSVELVGYFSIDIPQNEPEGPISDLLRSNTAAILFPYLRSTISQVTSTANIPTVNIPTYNVAAMLEEGKVEEGDIELES